MSSILVPKEYSILFSSSTANGAFNKSSSGASFYSDFKDHPINIPKEAVGAAIALEQASIWNQVANIVTGVNDQIDLIVNANPYLVTIPQGNYSVEDINTYINSYVYSQNPAYDNAFSITADYPTDLVRVTNKTNPSVQTEWKTQTNARTIAFGVTVGYTTDRVLTGTGVSVVGDQKAEINVIDNFVIHNDLMDDGILLNGSYNNIVGIVPINVAPSSLINYEPHNPLKLSSGNLKSVSGRTKVHSWVTNEVGQDIQLSDDWSYILRVSWYEPKVVS
jgi:hypothetical protein